MTTNNEITDKELRELYELLTKEQLIEALIKKHKECRDIEKNCVIPAIQGNEQKKKKCRDLKIPKGENCRKVDFRCDVYTFYK
ncbi:hypothetical protein [Massilibacteroides sp.]|uniref:hypothetical protein n=1 Tax=Massilibacteroides sp. TaxID=2034766 RepID=UPI002633706A|nr:hypothetical protein [Massilibacteroides sp.]MDD4515625.1 hypothetical protein [Massilibacteroides sp.]